MPILTLDKARVAYGHLPLFVDASLQIESNERVCLIGRNGTGKSTLLRILSGELDPDAGGVWRQPGLRVGRLTQDVALDDPRSVSAVVAEGLGPVRPDDEDAWRREGFVEQVLSRLDLPSDTPANTLSGGWRRRVLLARALVGQPDLLLLDEPTNHLDVESMTWLETFLLDYNGSVVFVTHDRVFLQRLATRIVELDRGRLTSWPGDYATFLRKKEDWLANEALQQQKFDKRLAEEETWLRQGIKARRTRNEGRVRALMEMRQERAQRRARIGAVKMQAESAERSGQMVIETEGLTKGYGGDPVVADLSLRIMRRDRVGLVGPNGSGKTTLLRLLVGELSPDAGTMRHGANVQIAYFDQQREQLDPERTVVDTVADGHDTVTVSGQSRHVHGYLRDFLFPPERALSKVKALSGGERNRLLLARLFTRPANLLVLDEPTNDLDIETLELLEAQLAEWPGTLLLVSHDRAFIDSVVTSTLVFEGQGQVREYVGGYEDWLHQRREAERAREKTAAVERARAATRTAEARPPTPIRKRSNREQQELQSLPALIEGLEAEQQALSAAVARPEFYKEGPDAIHRTLGRLEQLQLEILDAYARWDELDSRG